MRSGKSTEKGEQSMKVTKAIAKAKKDPNFGRKLIKLANKARAEGVSSEASKEFWSHFAESDDELLKLTTPQPDPPTSGNSPYKLPIANLLNAIKQAAP